MQQEPSFFPPPAPVHPVVGPPDNHEIHAPIRDENRETMHEDLDRQPDGVPHRTVGMTAFFAVLLAMLVAVMLVAGGTAVAILIACIAVPAAVLALNRHARRRRDRVHPSR